MAKYNGVLSPHQLQDGMIVEYGTQGGESLRRRQPISYGYIHDTVYDIQKHGKPLSHFVVYPVIRADEAGKSGRPVFILDPDKVDAHKELGLPPGTWAIVIDPIPLHPDQMGRPRDGLVRPLSDFPSSNIYSEFEEMAERYAMRGPEAGPRFAQRNPDNIWGVYIPRVKKGKNALEDFEPEKAGPKKRRRRKEGASSARQLDITLQNTVKAGLLDEDTARLLEHPEDKRVKPVTKLRELWEIANKTPEELAKYAPKALELDQDIPLAELEKQGLVHPTIVWGLSSPRDGRKGEGASPVASLKDAYNLVTQNPENMKKYNYLGVRYQALAIEQISAAYQSLAKSGDNRNTFVKSIEKNIKAAWKAISEAHAATMGIGGQKPAPVPERFKDDNGAPLWTFE